MRRTAAERTRDGRASPAQQRRVVSEPGKVGEEGRGQAAVQGREPRASRCGRGCQAGAGAPLQPRGGRRALRDALSALPAAVPGRGLRGDP